MKHVYINWISGEYTDYWVESVTPNGAFVVIEHGNRTEYINAYAIERMTIKEDDD